MGDFEGWETVEPPLGQGGQGTVYKARSPERAKEIRESAAKIGHGLRQLGVVGPAPNIEDLVTLIVDVGGPDNVKHLGALKVFHTPSNELEREKALGRLEAEILALKNISHPAVLKLLHSRIYHPKIRESFMVTEYHPQGPLEDHISPYKGRALEALRAFRPLVEAVAAIHHIDAIHRDIKLKNIFVANDGRLVLGDFGIVLLRDAAGSRLTETYERVGTRDWMAPWANTQHRLALADVNPTLDIFPLGKVLWCMISGRRGLEFWYYDRPAGNNRPANNLELLFPDDPAMGLVNDILKRCIVEEEAKCLQSAGQLLSLVDEAIDNIRQFGQRPDDKDRWLCTLCRQGYYGKESWRWYFHELSSQSGRPYPANTTVYFCDHCGHMQVFRTFNRG